MVVNELDHHLDRWSNSAIVKYADALRKILFACRNSAFSRTKSLRLKRP